MGKSGPAPKPTAMKALQGNPGRRPLNKKEPRPPGRARKEYGLKQRDPMVARLWDRYAPAMEAVGLLTPADEMAFLFLLRHVVLAREAYGMLLRESIIDRDEANVRRKHPALQIWRDNSGMALRYMKEFGLTPSGRVGLSVAEEDQPTLADELFELMGRPA